MEVVYSHCYGIDVHKKKLVACTITSEKKETRTFSAITDDIPSMVDWVKITGCTHVAMESSFVPEANL